MENTNENKLKLIKKSEEHDAKNYSNYIKVRDYNNYLINRCYR